MKLLRIPSRLYSPLLSPRDLPANNRLQTPPLNLQSRYYDALNTTGTIPLDSHPILPLQPHPVLPWELPQTSQSQPSLELWQPAEWLCGWPPAIRHLKMHRFPTLQAPHPLMDGNHPQRVIRTPGQTVLN